MPEDVDQLVATHGPRILGYLVRRVGNLDDAEDLQQEVLVAALTHWRRQGIPYNPIAWLLTTARHRVIDWYRHQDVVRRSPDTVEQPVDNQISIERYLDDDLLSLIFTCCHPALNEDTRVALTLKSIAGFSIAEVARAFLVEPKTMEQRLLRAKKKIRVARIPYEIPEPKQLDQRLGTVLQTIYLMFNEGYSATSGQSMVRENLCDQSIAIAAKLHEYFPGHAECLALNALLLLQDSRRASRVSRSGDLILLDAQDRSTWDRSKINQGTELLAAALHLQQAPGTYQVQAAIAALHTEATLPGDTDWPQIVQLYEVLETHNCSDVVKLNHVAALLMTNSFQDAASILADVAPGLDRYYPYYCVCAELAVQRGRITDAQRNFASALDLVTNDIERSFIRRRAASIGDRPD